MTASRAAQLSAADVLALRAVPASWNTAEDAGDADRWVGLFTADGSTHYGDGRVDAGTAALAAGARSRAADPAMAAVSHWLLGTPVVDGGTVGPDGVVDTAYVRHAFCTVRPGGGGTPRPSGLSERRYRMRRTDAGWRIVERTIHPLPRTTGDTVTDTTPITDDGTNPSSTIAVQDRIARWALARSAGDDRAAADLCTEDAVLVDADGRTARGPTGIAVALGTERDRSGPALRWSTNVLVQVDGDDATATSYEMAIRAVGGVRSIGGVVAVTDRLRRIDGGWWFTERHAARLGR